MNRILLTLLALLTGLSVSGGSAEARAQCVAEAESSIHAAVIAVDAEDAISRHIAPARVLQFTSDGSQIHGVAANTVVLTPVHIGMDRAHE